MQLLRTDVPVIVEGLYKELVEGYHLYFNPESYGGPLLLDDEAEELLQYCHGQSSVSEIQRSIRGEKVFRTLETMAKNEIVSISLEFTESLRESARKEPSFSCWLHLTNSCNLACKYCYIHKSPGSMSSIQGKELLNRLVKSCLQNNIGKLGIKYAGGEPLTKYSLLKDLVEYSEKMSCDVTIDNMLLTNGILLTSEIAEFLKRHHFHVGLSLDGLEEAHDRSRVDRRGRGSFQDVLKGLKILKDYHVSFSTLVTVSASSFRQLPEFTEFALKNGLRFRYSLERDIDTGHPALLDLQDELVDVLNECYDLIEANLPIKDINRIHKFCDVSLTRPINRTCAAGSSFTAIDHSGNMGLCGLGLSIPFGALEAGDDIIAKTRNSNNNLRSMKGSNYELCSSCFWRKSCAGGCPLQTYKTFGRYDMPSPYCQVFKAVIPRLLRIKGLQMLRDSSKESKSEVLSVNNI